MKRIEFSLTTEDDAYDPHATMTGADLDDYKERYRQAVETKLSEFYTDVDVFVRIEGFGSLYLEGFEDEDEEEHYIHIIQNEIFGNQSF